MAKFHHEHSGFLGIHEKTRASLEVFGEVSEAVLDMIMITFIYMEATRKQRERAATKASAKNVAGFVGTV